MANSGQFKILLKQTPQGGKPRAVKKKHRGKAPAKKGSRVEVISNAPASGQERLSQILGEKSQTAQRLIQKGWFTRAKKLLGDINSSPELTQFFNENVFTSVSAELSLGDAKKYIDANWDIISGKNVSPSFQSFLLDIESLRYNNNNAQAKIELEAALKNGKYKYTDNKGNEQTADLTKSQRNHIENLLKSMQAQQIQQKTLSDIKIRGYETALDAFKAARATLSKKDSIGKQRYESILIALIFMEKGLAGVEAYIESKECTLKTEDKKDTLQEYEIKQLIKDKKYAEAAVKAAEYFKQSDANEQKDKDIAIEYFGKPHKTRYEQQLTEIYTQKMMDEAGKLDSEDAIKYLKANRKEYEAKGINVDFYITYFEIQGLLQDNKYAKAKDKVEGLLKKGELKNGTRLTRTEVGQLKNIKKQVDEHDERVALAWQATLGFDDAETWINKAKDQEDFDLIASFELLTLDFQVQIEAKNYGKVEDDITAILEQGHYGESKTKINIYERKGLETLLVRARMAKISDDFKTAVEEKGFEAALKEFEANKEEHIKLIGEENYDKVIISVMMDEKGQGIKAVKQYIARDDVKARWEDKDIKEDMDLFWQSQEIEALLKQEKFAEAEKLAKEYFHTEAGYEESSYDSMMEGIYGQKLIKELEDMSFKQAKAYIKEHRSEYTKHDVSVDFYLLLIKVQELAANKQYKEAEKILDDALASGSFNTSLFLTGKETGKEITLKDNEVLRLAAQLSGLRAARAKEDYIDIFVDAGLEKGWETGLDKLKKDKDTLVDLLGSEFRYNRFVEETKIAAKQQLEGIDAAIAYVKANTKHLRELGIEPNDLLERLEVEKLLEDEKFDEAIAKAKEYFKDAALDQMLGVVYQQKTAKELEDLTISQGRAHLEKMRPTLEKYDIDVDFQLYMLDLQEMTMKKDYAAAITSIEETLKTEQFSRSGSDQTYDLKNNDRRNMLLMLVRVKAYKEMEDNDDNVDLAKSFIDKVLKDKKVGVYDVAFLEKELKSFSKSLEIQALSKDSPAQALACLQDEENKPNIIAAFGGGKTGKERYHQEIFNQTIQKLKDENLTHPNKAVYEWLKKPETKKLFLAAGNPEKDYKEYLLLYKNLFVAEEKKYDFTKKSLEETVIPQARKSNGLKPKYKREELFNLYLYLIQEIISFDGKEGLEAAATYLEENKEAIIKDIGEAQYYNLVDWLNDAKKDQLKQEKFNDLLQEGKIEEAIAYVKENKRVFGGKIDDKALEEKIESALKEGDFAKAKTALQEANLSKRNTDRILAYIEILEELYQTRFVVEIQGLPTEWQSFFADKPEIKDEDIKVNRNSLSLKFDEREQIIEIQMLLSGIANPDTPGQSYLPGGYKPGVMDVPTAIALINFINRYAPSQVAEHSVAGMLKDRKETKTLYIPFNQETIDNLREAYNTYNQDQQITPLNVQLAQTKLGSKIILEGEGTSASDIGYSDFIWYMIKYLELFYGPNTDQGRLLGRIEDAVFGNAPLSAADLFEFGNLCNTVKIEKDKLEKILSQSPTRHTNTFVNIQVNNGNLSIGTTPEEQAKNTVSLDQGEIGIYTPLVGVLRKPVAYFKKQIITRWGLNLDSASKGDQTFTAYFTGEDIGIIAKYLEDSGKLIIRHPIDKDSKLTDDLKALYGDLPSQSPKRKLVGKLLSWDMQFVVEKELEKVEAELKGTGLTKEKRTLLEERRDVLKGLLKAPRDKLESVLAGRQKDKNLSKENRDYLKALEKRASKNRTIQITTEEHLLLAKLAKEHEWLKPLLQVAPASILSASPQEILDLKNIAETYAGQQIDIDTLLELSKTGNSGAILLVIWMCGERRGVAEVQTDWWEAAPSFIDMGLSIPDLQKLCVLKRKYAEEKGLLKTAKKLKTQIDDKQKEIDTYNAIKNPTLEEKRKLANLVSEKFRLEAELNSIYDSIDGESLHPGFIDWLLNEYVQDRGWLEESIEYVTSGINKYSFQLHYKDVTSSGKKSYADALETLKNAETRLKAILGEHYDLRGLFSLDLHAEHLDLSEADRKELLQIKQAFCVFINMTVDFETINGLPSTKNFGNSLLYMIGAGASGNINVQLKLLAMSHYRYFLKQEHPDAYLDYIVKGATTKELTKYDIEIVAKILKESGSKDLGAKVEAWKNNEDVWTDEGYLNTSHDEVEETLKEVGKAMQDSGHLAVGQAGKDTNVGVPGPIDYLFQTDLITPEYWETVARNLKEEGYELDWKMIAKKAKELPKEAFCEFLAQQFMLRTLMPLHIYVGLPILTLRGESDPGSMAIMLLMWTRWAPLWYKQVWTELEQGHLTTAIAMYWAVNYIAARHGWAGIWGRTATLDAEFLKLLRMVPGVEKALPRRWKGILRYALEGTGKKIGESKVWQNNKRGKAIRGLRFFGKALWALNSPWHFAEHQLFELRPEEMHGWKKRATKAAQKNVLRFNYAFDYTGNRLFWVFQEGIPRLVTHIVPSFTRKGVDKKNLKENIRDHRQSTPKENIAPTDMAIGTSFMENGGSLVFGEGKTTAELRILPDGKFEAAGTGSLETNLTLGDLLGTALEGKGPLASLLNGNGQLSIKMQLPVTTTEKVTELRHVNLRVAEVLVVKGSETRVEILNHGMLDPAHWQVRLIISQEDFENPTKLQTSLANVQAAAQKGIRESHGHVKPEMTGERFEGSQYEKESKTKVDALENEAKQARIRGSQIDYKAEKFWDTFAQKAKEFKAGQLDAWEFRSWLLAANRRTYWEHDQKELEKPKKKQNLKHERILTIEQLKTIALFDIDPATGKFISTLLQFNCGQGKSFPGLFGAAQAALRGKKVYFHTTGKGLVVQISDLAEEPGFKVLQMLEQAGIIKIWVDDGSVKDSQRRAEMYRKANVVIQSYEQHAFDLGDGTLRQSIEPGIIIGDEADKPAVEDARTPYVQAGEPGMNENPIIARRLKKEYIRDCKREFKVFRRLMGAGEVTQKGDTSPKKNPYFEYDLGGRVVVTELGKTQIAKELNLAELDFKTLRHFEQFNLANELLLEERSPGHKEAKRAKGLHVYHDVDYHYIVKDGEVVLTDTNGEMKPGQQFGQFLDEALRLTYGFEIENRHINFSEVTLRDVWGFHQKGGGAVMGMSGTILENFEFLIKLYPEMAFRVIDMPNFLPEVKISLEDLNDPAKLDAKIAELWNLIEARRGAGWDSVEEVGGKKDVKIRAKIVLVDGADHTHPALTQVDTALGSLGVDAYIVQRNPWEIAPTRKAAIKASATEAVNAAAEGRPVIITVENIEDVNDTQRLFKEELARQIKEETNPDRLKRLKQIESDTFTAEEANPKKIKSLKDWAKKPFRVLISTRASRGTNIPADKAALYSAFLEDINPSNNTAAKTRHNHLFRGGMHVISIDPSSLSKGEQQRGRAPRGEKPGSSSIFISLESPVIQRFLKKGEIQLLKTAVEQGNSDLAQKMVAEAYRRAYVENFQSTHSNLKPQELKYGIYEDYASYLELLNDPKALFEKVAKDSISFLFEGLSIEPNKALGEKEVAELENRLSKLLGGRKVSLKALVGCDAQTAQRVLSKKIFDLFMKVQASRTLDADKGARHDFETARFKLQMLFGERWGQFSDLTERVTMESVFNDSPERLPSRIKQLGRMLFQNVFHDVFEWAFPKSAVKKPLQNAYALGPISLEVTPEDVVKGKTETPTTPAEAKPESPKYEAPQGIPTEGKVKVEGEVRTYRVNDKGAFVVYDGEGKAIGQLVRVKETGKTRFVRFGQGGINGVADPLTAAFKLAQEAARLRGQDAQIVSLESYRQQNKASLLKELDSLEGKVPKEVSDALRAKVEGLSPKELEAIDIKEFKDLVTNLRKSHTSWLEVKGGEAILLKQLQTFMPEAEALKIIEGLRMHRLHSWHGEAAANRIEAKLAEGNVTINGRKITKLTDLTAKEFRELLVRMYHSGGTKGEKRAQAAKKYLQEVWGFGAEELGSTAEETKESDIKHEQKTKAKERAAELTKLQKSNYQFNWQELNKIDRWIEFLDTKEAKKLLNKKQRKAYLEYLVKQKALAIKSFLSEGHPPTSSQIAQWRSFLTSSASPAHLFLENAERIELLKSLEKAEAENRAFALEDRLAEEKPLAKREAKQWRNYLDTPEAKEHLGKKRCNELKGKLNAKADAPKPKAKETTTSPKETSKVAETAPVEPAEKGADPIEQLRSVLESAKDVLKLTDADIKDIIETLRDPKKMKKAEKELAKILDSKKLSEFFFGTEEGRAILRDPEKGPKALELIAKANQIEQMRKAKKVMAISEYAGLIGSIVVLLGAEKLCDIIGIENGTLRFIFVMGLAESFGYGMQKITDPYLKEVLKIGQEGAAAAAEAGVKLSLGSKIIAFSARIVGGLAQISAVCNAYSLAMEGLGVPEDHFLRGHEMTLISGLLITHYLRKGAQKLGLEAILGRGAGFTFATALTILWGGGILLTYLTGDYGNYVHVRLIEKLKEKCEYDRGAFGTAEYILMGPGTHNGRVANEHSGLAMEIAHNDVRTSHEIRRSLALSTFMLVQEDIIKGDFEAATRKLQAHYGEEVEFGSFGTDCRLEADCEWGGCETVERCYTTIDEEDIYEFVINYIKNDHERCQIGLPSDMTCDPKDWDDNNVIDAVTAKFRISRDKYISLIPKFNDFQRSMPIRTLVMLDPERYLAEYQGLRRHKTKYLNDDVRTMFTKKGALETGTGYKFLEWCLKEINIAEFAPKGPERKMLVLGLRTAYLQAVDKGEIKGAKMLGKLLSSLGDGKFIRSEKAQAKFRKYLPDINKAIQEKDSAKLYLLLIEVGLVQAPEVIETETSGGEVLIQVKEKPRFEAISASLPIEEKIDILLSRLVEYPDTPLEELDLPVLSISREEEGNETAHLVKLLKSKKVGPKKTIAAIKLIRHYGYQDDAIVAALIYVLRFKNIPKDLVFSTLWEATKNYDLDQRINLVVKIGAKYPSIDLDKYLYLLLRLGEKSKDREKAAIRLGNIVKSKKSTAKQTQAAIKIIEYYQLEEAVVYLIDALITFKEKDVPSALVHSALREIMRYKEMRAGKDSSTILAVLYTECIRLKKDIIEGNGDRKVLIGKFNRAYSMLIDLHKYIDKSWPEEYKKYEVIIGEYLHDFYWDTTNDKPMNLHPMKRNETFDDVFGNGSSQNYSNPPSAAEAEADGAYSGSPIGTWD